MKLELAPERLATEYDKPPKLQVLYFTDPDCSWCWATEPAVKKILAEYAGQVRLIYKMGGLLETWNTFFDAPNRIGRPEEVAPHWIEVARRSGMPIDEKIWYEDPPDSTYPACIAYKAADLQNGLLADGYLRRLREAVMTERRNIAKESVLFELAEPCGFDMARLRADYRGDAARAAFFGDMAEGQMRRITGFPTMVVCNGVGEEMTLAGYRPYADYENAFQRLALNTLHKMPLLPIADFVAKHGCVATQEVATVYELDRRRAMEELEALAASGQIKKELRAGGEFWNSLTAPPCADSYGIQ